MCAHWKTIDDFSKNIFEELAEEGRRMYTKRVAEYEAKYPSAPPPPKKAKLAAAVTTSARKSLSNVKEARQDDVKYVVRDNNNPGKRSPDVVLSSSNKGAAAKETKPKRALSAYNLFFRFKRDKVLAACENAKNKPSKEVINRLILAAPGLEDDSSVSSTMSEEQVKGHRRDEIRSALYLDLFPKDTRTRLHRKSHGVMSFLEMNKVMCSSWKSIDTFARSVFEDLAEEGKRMYEKYVSEHRARYEDASRTEEATSPIALRPNNKKKKGQAIQTVSFASMEGPGLCIDGQDLDSMPLPPLPNFPDNFDLEDLRTEEMFVSDVSDDTSSSTHDCPSHDEVFEDFPNLPPFQVHETEEPQLLRDNKASADDFMKLIATLGDDCGDCVV